MPERKLRAPRTLCEDPAYYTQVGAPHEQEYCTCADCGPDPWEEYDND